MRNLGHIDVHGVSIRGSAHEENHDHFAIAALHKSMRLHRTNLSIEDDGRVHGENQGHLFLVADGLEGAGDPAAVSGTASEGLVRYFLNEMPWYHLVDGEAEEVTHALGEALHNAHQEVWRRNGHPRAGIRTSLGLAFLSWPNLYVAHTGDARCYLRRGSRVERLTSAQALGSSLRTLEPEVVNRRLRVGDTLALMTRAVDQQVRGAEMARILSTPDANAEEVCRALVSGSDADDRTAIVARFLENARTPAVSLDPPPAKEAEARRARGAQVRMAGKAGTDARDPITPPRRGGVKATG